MVWFHLSSALNKDVHFFLESESWDDPNNLYTEILYTEKREIGKKYAERIWNTKLIFNTWARSLSEYDKLIGNNFRIYEVPYNSKLNDIIHILSLERQKKLNNLVWYYFVSVINEKTYKFYIHEKKNINLGHLAKIVSQIWKLPNEVIQGLCYTSLPEAYNYTITVSSDVYINSANLIEGNTNYLATNDWWLEQQVLINLNNSSISESRQINENENTNFENKEIPSKEKTDMNNNIGYSLSSIINGKKHVFYICTSSNYDIATLAQEVKKVWKIPGNIDTDFVDTFNNFLDFYKIETGNCLRNETKLNSQYFFYTADSEWWEKQKNLIDITISFSENTTTPETMTTNIEILPTPASTLKSNNEAQTIQTEQEKLDMIKEVESLATKLKKLEEAFINTLQDTVIPNSSIPSLKELKSPENTSIPSLDENNNSEERNNSMFYLFRGIDNEENVKQIIVELKEAPWSEARKKLPAMYNYIAWKEIAYARTIEELTKINTREINMVIKASDEQLNLCWYLVRALGNKSGFKKYFLVELNHSESGLFGLCSEEAKTKINEIYSVNDFELLQWSTKKNVLIDAWSLTKYYFCSYNKEFTAVGFEFTTVNFEDNIENAIRIVKEENEIKGIGGELKLTTGIGVSSSGIGMTIKTINTDSNNNLSLGEIGKNTVVTTMNEEKSVEVEQTPVNANKTNVTAVEVTIVNTTDSEIKSTASILKCDFCEIELDHEEYGFSIKGEIYSPAHEKRFIETTKHTLFCKTCFIQYTNFATFYDNGNNPLTMNDLLQLPPAEGMKIVINQMFKNIPKMFGTDSSEFEKCLPVTNTYRLLEEKVKEIETSGKQLDLEYKQIAANNLQLTAEKHELNNNYKSLLTNFQAEVQEKANLKLALNSQIAQKNDLGRTLQEELEQKNNIANLNSNITKQLEEKKVELEKYKRDLLVSLDAKNQIELKLLDEKKDIQIKLESTLKIKEEVKKELDKIKALPPVGLKCTGCKKPAPFNQSNMDNGLYTCLICKSSIHA